jgi:hypothetical protein
MTKRKRFTAEFKREAVRLLKPSQKKSLTRFSSTRETAHSKVSLARKTLLMLWGQEVSMSKVENIEREVRNLTPSELAAFRQWFLEFDAQVWDRQIDKDIREGRLDKLADEALAAHRAGKSKEL